MKSNLNPDFFLVRKAESIISRRDNFICMAVLWLSICFRNWKKWDGGWVIIFVANSLLGQYWSLPTMRQFFYHQTTTTNKQTNIPKKGSFLRQRSIEAQDWCRGIKWKWSNSIILDWIAIINKHTISASVTTLFMSRRDPFRHRYGKQMLVINMMSSAYLVILFSTLGWRRKVVHEFPFHGTNTSYKTQYDKRLGVHYVQFEQKPS